MAPPAPRLTVELVPASCWYSNVRSLVDRAGWDRIRRKVYRQCGYRCEICGGRGPRHPVEAHEIWAYNDTTKVQTLTGMIGLCPACHEVKHLGLAQVRGRDQAAMTHLAQVNGWTAAVTGRYVEDAFAVWDQRSQHVWNLELGGLRPYVTLREYQAVVAAAETERAATLDTTDKDEVADVAPGGVVVIDLGPPDTAGDVQPPVFPFTATADPAAAAPAAAMPPGAAGVETSLLAKILRASGPSALIGWTVATVVLVTLLLTVGWWIAFVLVALALVAGRITRPPPPQY